MHNSYPWAGRCGSRALCGPARKRRGVAPSSWGHRNTRWRKPPKLCLPCRMGTPLVPAPRPEHGVQFTKHQAGAFLDSSEGGTPSLGPSLTQEAAVGAEWRPGDSARVTEEARLSLPGERRRAKDGLPVRQPPSRTEQVPGGHSDGSTRPEQKPFRRNRGARSPWRVPKGGSAPTRGLAACGAQGPAPRSPWRVRAGEGEVETFRRWNLRSGREGQPGALCSRE